jgi:hypothetical protein
LRHNRDSASLIPRKLRSRKIRRKEKIAYPLKTSVIIERLSFTTLSAKHHFLICVLLCLQFVMLKIINLYYLLSHILSASLESSQSIYHRNSYSRKPQKHCFNRSDLLRDNISSQFFVNRAKYINNYCYNTNYEIRYYMPPKGTRRLADNSKNSTSTLNKLTNRENISLGLPAKIPEKSKNRFLNTKSREIPIFSDSDRESFS